MSGSSDVILVSPLFVANAVQLSAPNDEFLFSESGTRYRWSHKICGRQELCNDGGLTYFLNFY